MLEYIFEHVQQRPLKNNRYRCCDIQLDPVASSAHSPHCVFELVTILSSAKVPFEYNNRNRMLFSSFSQERHI